jgi:4-amino-4-deoxy-L-arabinose transferase-like glycosyltransferase
MGTRTLARRPPAIALTVPPLAVPLVASAVAWCLLFAAVPPGRQDFPLNDDWAFARGAFQFAQGQGIDYGGWASMPQLGQWLWASPFVWSFGESHAALRLSTILLSWAGLAAFYDLLRQANVSPRRAALATATLAFGPLFFLLQGTFMTDVPALSLALASLALYARALRGQRSGWLAAACVVAVLAAVTRQNTLAVVGAAAALLWRRPDLRRRAGWWAGVLAPVAVGGVVSIWFATRSDVRALTPSLPAPAVLLSLPFLVVHLCGLSALPLLMTDWRRDSWKALAGAFAGLAAAAGYWLLYGSYLPYGGLFPYAENMLSPWGAFAGSRFTGPFVVGERPLLLDTATRVLLTLVGCAAGAALLVRLAGGWRSETRATPLTLFTLFAVPFLLIAPDVYDRYLLFLLPGVLGLVAVESPAEGAPEWRRRRLVEVAAVAVLAVVSVGLMHDWLAWNAARWELGRRAAARQVDPREIEGGVEWDGWYAPPGDAPAGRRRWPVLAFTREWFPEITGHYALSFAEVRGARRVDSEPYELWLQPGRREFLLIELPPVAARRAPDAPPQ